MKFFSKLKPSSSNSERGSTKSLNVESSNQTAIIHGLRVAPIDLIFSRLENNTEDISQQVEQKDEPKKETDPVKPNEEIGHEPDKTIFEEDLKTVTESIKYVVDCDESQKAANDPTFGEKLNNIGRICIGKYAGETKMIECLVNSKFPKFLIMMLKDSLSHIKEIVKNSDGDDVTTQSSDLDVKMLDVDKNYFLISKNLLSIVWYLTHFSNSFKEFFKNIDGIKVLNEYLSDITFVKQALNFKENECFKFKAFLLSVIGSIHNLSKSIPLDSSTITPTITYFCDAMKEIDDQHISILYSYLALANILTDHEIGALPLAETILKILTELLKLGADDIVNKTVRRAEIEFESEKVEVCQIDTKRNAFLDITEVITGIYRLAVNDSFKYNVYTKYGLQNILDILINEGNMTEKDHSLHLLYQLSFDRKVAEMIISNDKLLSKINEFIKIDGLSKNCKGILWNLNFDKKSAEPEAKKEFTNQVMISYNYKTRDDCMRIKEELEKMNYKVWIDVESIHGSSLESMANAIEQSDCILMCVTEFYKLSPNCRAEAEYAFSKRKPIVPLIMQSKYEADGWLGIIMGSKIYIDFTSFTFEDCIDKILFQMKGYLSSDSRNSSITSHTFNISTERRSTVSSNKSVSSRDSPIKGWNIEKVENWLNQMDIRNDVKEILKDFNGEMLIELFILKSDSRKHFYEIISKEKNLSLFDSIKFSTELDKLFESA